MASKFPPQVVAFGQPLVGDRHQIAPLRWYRPRGSLKVMPPDGVDPALPPQEEIPADLLDGADELAPPEEQARFAEWLRTGEGEPWRE